MQPLSLSAYDRTLRREHFFWLTLLLGSLMLSAKRARAQTIGAVPLASAESGTTNAINLRGAFDASQLSHQGGIDYVEPSPASYVVPGERIYVGYVLFLLTNGLHQSCTFLNSIVQERRYRRWFAGQVVRRCRCNCWT